MKGLLRKALIGVLVSLIVLLLITVFFGIRLSDVSAVGLDAFLFSCLLSVGSLLARGARFPIILRRYHGGLRVGFFKALLVRLGSEFIALVSFAYVGDEVFRLGWLTRKGVDSGYAAWIAYMEIFFDVLIGTALSLISAAFLLVHGAMLIGGATAAIAGVTLVLHLVFLTYSVKHVFHLPSIVHRLLKYLPGSLGERIYKAVDETLTEFSIVAQSVVGERNLGLILANILLTLLGALFLAGSLQVLLNAVGIGVDLLVAMVIVFASVALSTLPVTIGGSGLSEVGAAFSALAFYSENPWGAVVAWRIATYHIPLLLCGLAMAIVLAEFGKP